ncbi:DMT family transporter [Metabacillus sp. HB246100]
MLSNKQIDILAAVGFVVMWSSGFIGARLGTAEASSMTILMWRFIVAAIVLGGWWIWRQRKKLSMKAVISQSLIGLFAQGGYLYCVFLSVEHGVSAGTSNLITALQPIVAAALAGPILKESTTMKQRWGLVLGIIGVLFVVYEDLRAGAHVPLWAYALSFFAMVSLVGATLYEKGQQTTIDLVDALPIQTVISALLFTTIGFVTDNAIPPATTGFWLAVAWLAGFSTIGRYGFYWLNLKLGSVTRVSSLLYLTPPVTMWWSFLMFGDRIGFLTIVGMIICLLGVLVIRMNKAVEAQ